MAERPLLILPGPGEPIERQKKSAGRSPVHLPGRARQYERLTPRFEFLQKALEARRAALQTEARGLVPEEVVVLETVGTVESFIRAVENIPGMEWLAEVEEEDIPPDDDFFALNSDERRREDQALRGRLFMIFTNQEALRQLLSLWNSWREGLPLPRGLGGWRILFERLRDVRPWGIRDRLLETGVIDDWQDRLEHGQEVVPCEIELWYRHTPEQRRAAGERVLGLVEAQGGEVVTEAVIEGIAYHAILARLPVDAIPRLLDEASDEAALIRCEQIQFFRASGQMIAVPPSDERGQDGGLWEEAVPAGRPAVALLDGLPLQGHHSLEGRLIVDDPDGFEASYQASERCHGTSMASLILHGDLGAGEAPLPRPLYVRPILQPDSRLWNSPRPETVPEGVLVVDLIHRAVRRLFEGEGDQPPVAPEVAIFNLSIGIRDRPFDGSLSPLARLLDWLAWRYKVLFVVSAGNHSRSIELTCTREIFRAYEPPVLQAELVRAVAADARHRRLLSPAEGLNTLTVGALQADASNEAQLPPWMHPYIDNGLPSLINAQGMGYRRAIKPELLAPGGCILVQEDWGTTDGTRLRIYGGGLPPGQRVAAPGPSAGDRSATWHTRGTSNATALVSRAAAQLYDFLDELRSLPNGEIVDLIPRAVWLKALLAHGAEWGSAGSTLDGILKGPDNSRQFKEYLTRLLGYGSLDISKVQECSERRVTVVSGGVLREEQSHVHRFPLPPSLSGKRGSRRLAITLAWLTPVNPRHQSWRRADLWFAPPGGPLGVKRQQADWHAVQRGTLQHEILEGEKATVFLDGANLEIQVSCRADAGALEEEVPYALLATLEGVFGDLCG